MLATVLRNQPAESYRFNEPSGGISPLAWLPLVDDDSHIFTPSLLREGYTVTTSKKSLLLFP